ncbi:aldehyde dehydrogenase family protein [Pigmentiphaga sp. H8]|uniref:benzaldehyde dehydrogenase n=1 Tax=unclassified Pigmentiphaga TaxID=2626614 RepID=UPI000F5961D1|nr:benzaldehyde dehydrogenase [Pigmentiphaga sp. H8]AZG08839.1 aldehyde dehydrogenase family protein [Pigmentiphaga sp. H8]
MRAPDFLDVRPWTGKLFQGSWSPADGLAYDAIDKADGTLLARLTLATPAALSASTRLAEQAQPAWAATPHDERAAILRRAAGLVERHHAEAAEWIMRETGAIRAKADMELRSAVLILHQAAAMLGEPQGLVFPSAADRLSYGRRIPHGVVGVIAPFNFPLTLSMRAVAPALATGNAVVLKPDPQTAVSGGLYIARLFEDAGLPAGLLHVLPGGAEVGEAMCVDPRIGMVAFTGSTAAGKRVGALCGERLKKVSLELGGKNSLIVLDDADLELAAGCAAFGAWMHQGQICMATGRILAHESIAGRLVDLLADKAGKMKTGDPRQPGVRLGPMINARQLGRVDQLVKRTIAAGARLCAGGLAEGPFYAATVLDGVQPGMPAFDEEVFGPVALVTPFSCDEEAVALANRSEYGLSAAVVSRSVARAMALGRRLRTGLLHINDQTVAGDPRVPFGGMGASGNGGRIGGPANWDEFTQWQWVTVQDRPPAYPF